MTVVTFNIYPWLLLLSLSSGLEAGTIFRQENDCRCLRLDECRAFGGGMLVSFPVCENENFVKCCGLVSGSKSQRSGRYSDPDLFLHDGEIPEEMKSKVERDSAPSTYPRRGRFLALPPGIVEPRPVIYPEYVDPRMSSGMSTMLDPSTSTTNQGTFQTPESTLRTRVDPEAQRHQGLQGQREPLKIELPVPVSAGQFTPSMPPPAPPKDLSDRNRYVPISKQGKEMPTMIRSANDESDLSKSSADGKRIPFVDPEYFDYRSMDGDTQGVEPLTVSGQSNKVAPAPSAFLTPPNQVQTSKPGFGSAESVRPRVEVDGNLEGNREELQPPMFRPIIFRNTDNIVIEQVQRTSNDEESVPPGDQLVEPSTKKSIPVSMVTEDPSSNNAKPLAMEISEKTLHDVNMNFFRLPVETEVRHVEPSHRKDEDPATSRGSSRNQDDDEARSSTPALLGAEETSSTSPPEQLEPKSATSNDQFRLIEAESSTLHQQLAPRPALRQPSEDLQAPRFFEGERSFHTAEDLAGIDAIGVSHSDKDDSDINDTLAYLSNVPEQFGTRVTGNAPVTRDESRLGMTPKKVFFVPEEEREDEDGDLVRAGLYQEAEGGSQVNSKISNSRLSALYGDTARHQPGRKLLRRPVAMRFPQKIRFDNVPQKTFQEGIRTDLELPTRPVPLPGRQRIRSIPKDVATTSSSSRSPGDESSADQVTPREKPRSRDDSFRQFLRQRQRQNLTRDSQPTKTNDEREENVRSSRMTEGKDDRFGNEGQEQATNVEEKQNSSLEKTQSEEQSKKQEATRDSDVVETLDPDRDDVKVENMEQNRDPNVSEVHVDGAHVIMPRDDRPGNSESVVNDASTESPVRVEVSITRREFEVHDASGLRDFTGSTNEPRPTSGISNVDRTIQGEKSGSDRNSESRTLMEDQKRSESKNVHENDGSRTEDSTTLPTKSVAEETTGSKMVTRRRYGTKQRVVVKKRPVSTETDEAKRTIDAAKPTNEEPQRQKSNEQSSRNDHESKDEVKEENDESNVSKVSNEEPKKQKTETNEENEGPEEEHDPPIKSSDESERKEKVEEKSEVTPRVNVESGDVSVEGKKTSSETKNDEETRKTLLNLREVSTLAEDGPTTSEPRERDNRQVNNLSSEQSRGNKHAIISPEEVATRGRVSVIGPIPMGFRDPASTRDEEVLGLNLPSTDVRAFRKIEPEITALPSLPLSEYSSVN